MKQIIILGGGFAGVAAAVALKKHVKENLFSVTLVDKYVAQTFTPSLYEVATSEEPQKNIAIPFSEIFGTAITVKQTTVTTIDTKNQKVLVENGEAMNYDYLIIALGSESADYGIEGLKQYAMPLKWLEDAVAIKEKIKNQCCKDGECNKKTQIIIGGGGFSGTELAAELLTYKDRLAKQFNLAKDCLEVSIIQGSDRLLNELDPHVSDIAQKRIAGPMTHFCFGGHIKKVTDKEISTDDGKTYPYDIFIWTGGIKGSSVLSKSGLPVNKKGQLPVNEQLQMKDTTNIFVVGDAAEFTDPKTKQFAVTVAQVAEDEGKIAGENVYRLITNKPLLNYAFHHLGYIVPLRGRFASAELMGSLHFDGFLGWVTQQLVFFYYLLHILPLWKSFKDWRTFELELSQ